MASEPTWEAVKFGGGGGGEDAPSPPISFCTSRGSSYKRSMPMLCPSNGDVLATPLVMPSLHPFTFLMFFKSCFNINNTQARGSIGHPIRVDIR